MLFFSQNGSYFALQIKTFSSTHEVQSKRPTATEMDENQKENQRPKPTAITGEGDLSMDDTREEPKPKSKIKKYRLKSASFWNDPIFPFESRPKKPKTDSDDFTTTHAPFGNNEPSKHARRAVLLDLEKDFREQKLQSHSPESVNLESK